jgi:hypothetical protein
LATGAAAMGQAILAAGTMTAVADTDNAHSAR